MSQLVEHARAELEHAGVTAEDPDYADALVRAVAAFDSYDHSDASADCAIRQLTALLRWETLGPLTDNPTEWFDHGIISGERLWQSRRNPAAFSVDGGRSYYLTSEGASQREKHPLHLTKRSHADGGFGRGADTGP
jgi:hypothetical protein